MNRGQAARLAKLEKGNGDGLPAIVFVASPDECAEAEAKAARLEAQGRRVLLVTWRRVDETGGKITAANGEYSGV